MVRISRYVYSGAAWLFLALVVTQVFLAGMAVVAMQISWDAHRGLGHMLGIPILFMLISAYTGRMPGTLKRWTWALFGVFILQAEVLIFLRQSAPVLSAFHPVLALVDFALGWYLARRAAPLLQESTAKSLKPQSREGGVGI